MQSDRAELKMECPGGDFFFACWPRKASKQLLMRASVLFNGTIDEWIKVAEEERAGEVEYSSWFEGAPKATS